MTLASELRIKVVPGASRTTVDGFHGDGSLKIRLQAPPVDGAANEALIEFLARSFSLRKSDVELIRGEKSRLKTVRLRLAPEETRRRLDALLGNAGQR